MKVLHLSTYGATSGAGVATLRLLEAERLRGINAELLLMAPCEEPSSAIHSLSNRKSHYYKWQCRLWGERAIVALLNGFNREQTFKLSLGWLGISKQALLPYLEGVDIIHLHWTQHAFLSLSTLESICQLSKPIVITLHDYWWAQGIQQMGTSERLSAPLHKIDKNIRQRKQRLMALYPIHWVPVSDALSRAVSHSELHPSKGISTIGNALSSDYYEQALRQDSSTTSEPSKLYQIIFVATRIDDPVKGWNYLIAALQHLSALAEEQTAQMRLTLVGTISDHALLQQIPLPVRYLGSIAETDRLQELYQESSVLISTSEQESFGQTLLEALACGTPVIARDSGGPADIILEGINGRLVAHDQPEEMATALWEHFSGRSSYEAEACRSSALRFAPETIAQQYAQLYERLLNDC